MNHFVIFSPGVQSTDDSSRGMHKDRTSAPTRNCDLLPLYLRPGRNPCKGRLGIGFGVQMSSGGRGGSTPCEGVGIRKLGMSFETQGSRQFCRDIPGVSAKFESRKFVFNSEVSKRGRTEGVGARRSFMCQRFRPLCCTLFPMPPYERGTHFWRTFWPFLGVCLSPNPLPPTPFRNL